MILPPLSLNSLRTFEAAARHLHFTRAANELCVTQAAVSHQIKALEAQLGKPLFERTARGLRLSDAGATLAPALQQAFAQLAQALQALDDGAPPERLCVGVVGTFLHGHLLARLPDFERQHPRIDLQLRTHNNKLDLLVEGLDAAIRFGDGAWRSEAATAWTPTPLAPLCSPELAQRLQAPDDLRHCTLLRSFRTSDWPAEESARQRVRSAPRSQGRQARRWRRSVAGHVRSQQQRLPPLGLGPKGGIWIRCKRCRSSLWARAHGVVAPSLHRIQMPRRLHALPRRLPPRPPACACPRRAARSSIARC